MIDREELRRLIKEASCEVFLRDYSPNPHEERNDEIREARAKLARMARTAVPALLDALEEQEAMTSALNGDVTELGQRLEAAEERERGLRKALEEIARQKLHAEITDSDPDELDWLGGYEGCVKRARKALAETAP